MQLNKALDEAIRIHETNKNSDITAGYVVNGRTYPDYISNASWAEFCRDMQNNHKKAYENYKNGDGKELDERKVDANVYPPKMASFGSSSRFIYNLMKKDADFSFEEQLPTTVGGTANLDGFRKTETGYIFVEAKCREPYSVKNNICGQKYKALYDFITESDKTPLTVDMDLTKGKEHEMEVVFKYNNEEIKYFDIKQMISHLAGVGTAFLNGKYEIADIYFIYLLFNPTKILIGNPKAKDQIEGIYNNVCNICNTINFKNLFEIILGFLQDKKELGKDKNISDIAENFSFVLCDQDSQIIV